jgi:hypothetical protein
VLIVLADTGSMAIWRESVPLDMAAMHLVTVVTDQIFTSIALGPKQIGRQLAAAQQDGKIRSVKLVGTLRDIMLLLSSAFMDTSMQDL